MAHPSSTETTTLVRTSEPNLDEELRRMAHLQMGQVVYHNEYNLPRVGNGPSTHQDAKAYLASQMYTDAVFNQDIRVIQTIINRVDGGLPKDIDVAEYQTLFGDCMNQVLDMDDSIKLKVMPNDTVMMALCKSLYDLATADIYHVMKSDVNGNKWAKKVNPSTERKQARDSALRMVLERAGGRKTSVPAKSAELGQVVVASWITAALPQEGDTGEDRSESCDRGAGVAL
jgi:hypothetical protein